MIVRFAVYYLLFWIGFLTFQTTPATEAQTALIVAILGALGTFVVTLISARNSARKSDFEGLQLTVGVMRTEMSQQAEMIARQNTTIANLQAENNTLHNVDLQQRAELEAVRIENRQLRAEVDRLTAENVNLRTELADYKAGKKRQTGELK